MSHTSFPWRYNWLAYTGVSYSIPVGTRHSMCPHDYHPPTRLSSLAVKSEGRKISLRKSCSGSARSFTWKLKTQETTKPIPRAASGPLRHQRHCSGCFPEHPSDLNMFQFHLSSKISSWAEGSEGLQRECLTSWMYVRSHTRSSLSALPVIKRFSLDSRAIPQTCPEALCEELTPLTIITKAQHL